jgi:hypothetical protein
MECRCHLASAAQCVGNIARFVDSVCYPGLPASDIHTRL